jgi:hypothetical protein
MASGQRSTWPTVLFLGVCISLLIGTAAAVAAPSEEGGDWWRDGTPQRITGTVLEVDPMEGTVVLDGLVAYDPVRASIGTLVVEVDDVSVLHVDDTIDVEATRHDGRWTATSVEVLDTD